MIMMSDMVDELVRLGASQEDALETALKCKGSTTGSGSMQLVTIIAVVISFAVLRPCLTLFDVHDFRCRFRFGPLWCTASRCSGICSYVYEKESAR
jgi:hypothetical protein